MIWPAEFPQFYLIAFHSNRWNIGVEHIWMVVGGWVIEWILIISAVGTQSQFWATPVPGPGSPDCGRWCGMRTLGSSQKQSQCGGYVYNQFSSHCAFWLILSTLGKLTNRDKEKNIYTHVIFP